MLRKSAIWVLCLVLIVVLALSSGGVEGRKVQAQQPEGEGDSFSPPIMVSSDGRRSDPQNRPPGQGVSAQALIKDEEVAVIVGNAVSVWDPSPADSSAPVSFQIAEGTGWRDIATGDFDGNGDMEIVVIDNYAWVKVYNPGGPPMGFSFSKSYYNVLQGRTWVRVATGDTDGDNRDEIVVISTPISDASILYVIDPKDGNEPSVATFSGGTWYYIDVGQFLGDGRAEVALAEYYKADTTSPEAYFYLWDPWNPMTTMYGYKRSGPFYGLAMGDLDRDGRAEVFLSRAGKHDPSLLGFDFYISPPEYKVYDLGSNLPSWGEGLGTDEYPGWGHVDLGDITGNGDDERVGVRDIPKNAPDDFENFLVGDKYYVQPDEPNTSEGYHFIPATEWQGVKLLDYNGDGNKEPVFRKGNYVAGYDWVVLGGAMWPFGSAAFAADVAAMAVGDFESPMLQVTPEQLTFLMDRHTRELVPASMSLQINITSGEFNWTATYTSTLSWLKMVPTSDTEPSKAFILVDAAAVPTDTVQSYNGWITFNAPSGVYDSPKVVTATLKVLDEIFSVYEPHVRRD